MNNWRPEDWNPDYTITLLEDANSGDVAQYTNVIVKSAYEAGADAMLEALKELGKYYNDVEAPCKTIAVLQEIKERGWLVFIPDKEG